MWVRFYGLGFSPACISFVLFSWEIKSLWKERGHRFLWNCWLFVNKSGGANTMLLENYVFSILLADFCRDNFCKGTLKMYSSDDWTHCTLTRVRASSLFLTRGCPLLKHFLYKCIYLHIFWYLYIPIYAYINASVFSLVSGSC